MTPLRLALVALALTIALPPALGAVALVPGAVSVVDFAFEDAQTGKSVTVMPAGSITFTFAQGCHTATAQGSFNSHDVCSDSSPNTFTVTLAPGVYRYACSFHPSMTGTIVVTT